METFLEYLSNINNPQHRKRMEELFLWILESFPSLETRIAWNQPMFTDHGTFIIAFSIAKKHMSIAPERAPINYFSEKIVQAGYEHSKELIRVPWDGPLDLSLLKEIIEFNIMDKAECTSFWRK